jgi:hypothetical protein
MPQVALVYGSFLEGNSKRDIDTIFDSKPAGLDVSAPIEGNAFEFNSLKDTKAIVISCSSMNGFPAAGFHEFAKHLFEAANTNPGCLSHLSHAVYGNGDPDYEGVSYHNLYFTCISLVTFFTHPWSVSSLSLSQASAPNNPLPFMSDIHEHAPLHGPPARKGGLEAHFRPR